MVPGQGQIYRILPKGRQRYWEKSLRLDREKYNLQSWHEWKCTCSSYRWLKITWCKHDCIHDYGYDWCVDVWRERKVWIWRNRLNRPSAVSSMVKKRHKSDASLFDVLRWWSRSAIFNGVIRKYRFVWIRVVARGWSYWNEERCSRFWHFSFGSFFCKRCVGFKILRFDPRHGMGEIR